MAGEEKKESQPRHTAIAVSFMASKELGVLLAGSFDKRRAIESFIVWLAKQPAAARMAFIAENEPPAEWAAMEAVAAALKGVEDATRRERERAEGQKRTARQRGA